MFLVKALSLCCSAILEGILGQHTVFGKKLKL